MLTKRVGDHRTQPKTTLCDFAAQVPDFLFHMGTGVNQLTLVKPVAYLYKLMSAVLSHYRVNQCTGIGGTLIGP